MAITSDSLLTTQLADRALARRRGDAGGWAWLDIMATLITT
jgi:hypothetical protein